MGIEGQVVWVTGASGALGSRVARAFRTAGAIPVLVGRDAGRLARLAAELAAPSVEVDLADLASAEAAVARTRAEHGRVDGLVHCVGGYAGGPLHLASLADYHRLIASNLGSLFVAVRAMLPALRDQGSGWIAAIAARQAWEGRGRGDALYAASKAAALTLLRSLDAELDDAEVGITACVPMGTIDTPDNRAAMPHADRSAWIDPDAIAEALVFAASRPPAGRLVELPVYGRRTGKRATTPR